MIEVKPHQVQYALSNGLVPEPKERFDNKRLFEAADLDRLAKHFNISEIKHKENDNG